MMICMEQAYPLRRRYCASVSAAKALLCKRIRCEGVTGQAYQLRRRYWDFGPLSEEFRDESNSCLA